MSQNYINHIAIVLDESTSMSHITNQTIQVADSQVQHLANRSKDWDQETRATVYTFNADVRCIYYDKDVLRLPSIKNNYRPSGSTSLIDATIKAIEDLKKTATLYGDHAFLLYVITDGEENTSYASAQQLTNLIQSLPNNWTVAALVPGASGVYEAKKYGFPAGNIQVWETTAKGMREVGETIRRTTDVYMQGRSQGVTSYSNLFSPATDNLTPGVLSGTLQKLGPKDYTILRVDEKDEIRNFVVTRTGRAYKAGDAFYQLTKPEEVQVQKQVAIRNKLTGEVFTGREARQMLNLPDFNVKVAPTSHPQFDIFVQSTSTNRKLVPNTELLVLQ